MTAFTALMDVAAAPSGMALERGVWFTHGIDLQLFANHVAPALVGESLRDVAARRRRAAAFEFSNKSVVRPDLAVVADGRHLSPGPAIPWARIMPVHGRVQHAKFGVLVFRSTEKSRRRIRAFVSSANLTSSGLGSNHEFLAVEDRASGSTQPTLAADLVESLLAFVGGTFGSPGQLRPADRNTLAVLRRQLASLTGPRAGLVAHSLDTTRHLAPIAKQPARRIDIVSPAFAAPADSAVVTKGLAGHIDASSEVVWHLSPRPDGEVVVPKAAWQALRETSADVTVSVVGANEAVPRPLHSKLLCFTGATTVEVVAGSANFTSRGLGGRNRELVVRWQAKAKSFHLVDTLDSVPLGAKPGYTVKQEGVPDEDTLPLPIIAVESIDQDEDGSLTGLLKVTDIPNGTKVEVRVGRVWRTIDQLETLTISAGAALVEVRLTKGDVVRTSSVPVDYSSSRSDLWMLRGDRDTEIGTELDSLLAVVRRAAREQRASTSPGPDGTANATAADDRYLRKLEQPLVLLARYREQLVELDSPQELEAALERFDTSLPVEQWNPTIEGRIARTLLGLSAGSGSRLLKVLKGLAQ